MDNSAEDDTPLRDHGSFAHTHAVDPDEFEGTYWFVGFVSIQKSV